MMFKKNVLESIVLDYMKEESIPGLALGLVKDRKILYTNGFGVKNINKDEKITEETIFHMASISKTFVATAIMQLYERGKLDIYKPVINYIPYFKLSDKRYGEITIQQMLSHLSGMPDVEDYEWDNPQYDDNALERYVKSLDNIKLMWEPGEKFSYSNITYEILGDIISKVSEMTFENYMKENILNPLEMNNSTYLKQDVPKGSLVSPHIRNESGEIEVSNIFPYNRIHGPSSTLYSNALEMCNYVIAYMDKGRYSGKEIFKEETYLKMIRPCKEIGRGNKKIGLGWFLENNGEDKDIKIMHSGEDIGFRSNLIIQPEVEKAIIVMSNYRCRGISAFSKTILDII